MAGYDRSRLQEALLKYSKKHSNVFSYGTAGFRTRAEDLEHVLFRMGLVAVLRSRFKSSASIGLMITASHNVETDNGVKLVDPYGEMLEQSWEVIAIKFANIEDSQVGDAVEELLVQYQIDFQRTASVFIGRDTRPSSPALLSAAMAGVHALFAVAIDYGIITTPMLHYFVTCQNTDCAYGRPSEDGYFAKLSDAFKALRRENSSNGKYTPELEFDGANSVGAIKFGSFLRYLGDSLKVVIHNGDITQGKLNFQCGADHVKTTQTPPIGVPIMPFRRCASVDGDADRIVYYYTDCTGKLFLLDGDRIATLIAGYLMEIVHKAGLNLNIGVVQTAYANGSSTKYITETLKVPVVCVSTGVKHLHHKALEYDIGVYFEANGHGTVVYSENAKNKIKECTADRSADFDRLASIIDMTNETVGDAFSDLLLVETVLHARGWSIQDWYNTYTELPTILVKVSVKDRNVITTTDSERKCVTPVGLQAEIDKLVSLYPNGRSFVRPSGTEDVVRVFAEADTVVHTKDLARKVTQVVYDLAGGVGPFPTI